MTKVASKGQQLHLMQKQTQYAHHYEMSGIQKAHPEQLEIPNEDVLNQKTQFDPSSSLLNARCFVQESDFQETRSAVRKSFNYGTSDVIFSPLRQS